MEQSYKEKYEQAIERLKQWDREHPCAGYVLSDRDKFIFPELAESEDEKVRKELIKHLKELSDWKEDEVIPVKNPSYYRQWATWLEKQGQVKESTISQHEIETCKENDNSLTSEDEKIRKALIKLVEIENIDGYLTLDGIDIKDVLDWLERQGEHANFRNKIQVGDKVTRNEDGVLVNLTQLKRVSKPRERQCEQKVGYTTIMETGDGGINALVIRDIEIPFCAKDSELQEFTYFIPQGYYAKIEDDKVVIKKGEQEPEENKGNIGGISPNWSEEDEAVLDALIRKFEGEDIHVSPHLAVECLKSLKGRVQQQKYNLGDTELTKEEVCEGLIRGMVNEHNRVTKEVLRTEYEKGRADVLAKIDAIDVDEMVCDSGATSRVTQYWYAHGVNDVIKKLKEEQV